MNKKNENEPVQGSQLEATPARPSEFFMQRLDTAALEIYISRNFSLLVATQNAESVAAKCYSMALPIAEYAERVRTEGIGIIQSPGPQLPVMIEVEMPDVETGDMIKFQVAEDPDGFCPNAAFSAPANLRSRVCRELLAKAEAAGKPIPLDGLVRDYVGKY